MSDQQPASMHLRRLLPLIAVVGLLGPGAAAAGTPAPDQSPGAAGPSPDPAPVRHAVTRKPAAVTPLIVELPKRTINDRVQTPVEPKPQPPQRARSLPHARPVIATPIVDVTPSFVDVHPGLGALPRDESRLVLAAAALLAAAAAAGTGTMLTVTARVRR